MSRSEALRERRLNDAEFMELLKSRFFFSQSALDCDVYRLCGTTLNADLVELGLSINRLKDVLMKTWLMRKISGGRP